MLKRYLIAGLTGMVLYTTQASAQVNIGSPATPEPGILLQLTSNNRGLRLTQVSLTSTGTFGLNGTNNLTTVRGTIVYNTNAAITSASSAYPALGAGLYMWDGTGWLGMRTGNPTEAGSGLVATGNTIALGGPLTANTTVPLAGYNLTFSGTTGKFGIGNLAAPTNILHVNGADPLRLEGLVNVTNSAAYKGLVVDATGVTKTVNYMAPATTGSGVTVNTAGNVNLGGTLTAGTSIGLNGNNLTFNGTTGNVGFGNVATPTNTVHINGAADPLRLEGLVNVANSASYKGLVVDANGVTKTVNYTAPATTGSGVTVNSTGNVNLGGTLTAATSVALNGNNLTFSGTTGKVGVGNVTTPTNVLHVAGADPLRLEGLVNVANSTAYKSVVVDANGVAKTVNYTDPATSGNGTTVTNGVVNLGSTLSSDVNMTLNGKNFFFNTNTNGGKVAIGTVTVPTNTLHVKATSDPVKIEGLQQVTNSTSLKQVVVDASGVLKIVDNVLPAVNVLALTSDAEQDLDNTTLNSGNHIKITFATTDIDANFGSSVSFNATTQEFTIAEAGAYAVDGYLSYTSGGNCTGSHSVSLAVKKNGVITTGARMVYTDDMANTDAETRIQGLSFHNVMYLVPNDKLTIWIKKPSGANPPDPRIKKSVDIPESKRFSITKL